MPSIFTRIIHCEIPAFVVAEDEKHIAFLDISPLALGHTLVIPKREEDYIFDLSDQELSELMIFSKKIASAMMKSVSCKRIGLSVIGLEVPHAHVHLVPLNSMGDINFSNPKVKLSKEEFVAIAEKIKSNFNS
ncbi:MAG: HIT family protein [Chryseotalea sp. WA131a]|jgi:histidine triad (HIT) family protein|nr:MAG: HIT family protein [Chryseotalea sp. WA131a]